jgi:ribosomal protein S18 acetylase RimI-like enzyme
MSDQGVNCKRKFKFVILGSKAEPEMLKSRARPSPALPRCQPFAVPDILAAELPANTDHIHLVRELILQYAEQLDDDAALCTRTLDEELASLSDLRGIYAPAARGRFLLALHESEVIGGAGIRDLGSQTAELRRLYIHPDFRARQLGRWLALAAIHEAVAQGFRRIRLETTPSMAAAQKLYEDLGFRDVEASTPASPVLTMELELP